MLHRLLVILSVAVALICSGVQSAIGAENVWSGIVVANNVAKPEPTPAELTRIEDTLKELFGYNQTFSICNFFRKRNYCSKQKRN